ncbi:MAG: hypothetical protein Q9157_004948 [Trypethelium eluteriae]
MSEESKFAKGSLLAGVPDRGPVIDRGYRGEMVVGVGEAATDATNVGKASQVGQVKADYLSHLEEDISGFLADRLADMEKCTMIENRIELRARQTQLDLTIVGEDIREDLEPEFCWNVQEAWHQEP